MAAKEQQTPLPGDHPLMDLPDNENALLDAGDTDDEDEVDEPLDPHALHEAEIIRQQRDAFDQFIQEDDERKLREVNEEIQKLKSGDPSKSLVGSVRDYQSELFARAKAENIITVLDTGSGKTLIAALLIKHIVAKELDDRAAGKPPRTSFFLANSVALVEQQHQMLCDNLAAPPAIIHGRIVDNWTRDEWREVLQKHEAIVCTAEILNRCLYKNIITIPEINLLIFDEAHHAKKEHPYSSILKDHYFQVPKSERRPKIFGTTASPVDGKSDVLKAAETLEKVLDSKICTTRSLSLQVYAPKATVENWEYNRSPDPVPTALCQELQFCRKLTEFKPYFKDVDTMALKLGPWCADQIWNYALEDRRFTATIRKYEGPGAITNGQVDQVEAIKLVKEAEHIARCHDFAEPYVATQFMHPKVILLYEKLAYYFGRNENSKCLIFVDQRIKARLLCDLFIRLKVPNMRPDIFLGMGQSKAGRAGMTNPQFRELRAKFEGGIINCLFCTSVAEEGIDSPECNLVIRFDLYHTMIQYIQSRGRARAPNSVYGQLIDRSNVDHKIRVDQAREHEKQLRRFLECLDEDRFLENNYLNMQGVFDKAKNKKFSTSLGAVCSFKTAIGILDRYVASLKYKGATEDQVVYEPEITDATFQFQTILPEESPLNGASGEPAANKRVAKQSAAWATCAKLRQLGELNDELDPIHLKERPHNANAKAAVSEHKKEEYDCIVKPQFWTKDCGPTPELVFASIIHLVPSTELKRQHDPLLLLTRAPMPKISEFPLYLEKGNRSQVKVVQLSAAYKVTTKMLDVMKRFTFQIFLDIFNKRYEATDGQMPYWLAPTKWRPGLSFSDRLEDLVDLDPATNFDPLLWTPGSDPAAWCGQFIVDMWSGKNHYWSSHIVEGNTIESEIPSGLPPRRSQGKKGKPLAETVGEYTYSVYGKTREDRLAKFDPEQPVIEAEFVGTARDFLDDLNSTGEETVVLKYHICPEPLKVSRLPHGSISTALVFPAIMSRMDSCLIALEAGRKAGLELDPALALEAMTKDADNSDEMSGAQIHVQRGMGKNYERLEFLGDSFLKMSTSITVFIRHPKSDEFHFHAKRMAMITNRNLFNVSLDPSLNLPPSIRSKGFNRRSWYPEGMILKGGKGASNKPVAHELIKHQLAEKSIADVSEALIGAALLTTEGDFDLAIRAVDRLVDSPDHNISQWSDYSRLYEPPLWSIDTTSDGFTFGPNSHAKCIQARLGYTFNYPRLLRSAMTHPSVQTKNVPDYQRLEFLGDSILDMVCIRNLYDRFPDRDPQWLTEHKMAMVSNKFLGALAVDLEFDKYLDSSGTAISSHVYKYASLIRERLPNAKRDGRIDFWSEIEDPPKCLSDTVESYMGAVFVDSGFDYSEVERFFADHVLWYFSDMAVYDTFANKQPTTFLNNILTKQFHCRHMRIRSYPRTSPATKDGRRGPESVVSAVMIHAVALTSDEAKSEKYAKIRASKKAIGILKGMSMDEFREKFLCNCKEE